MIAVADFHAKFAQRHQVVASRFVPKTTPIAAKEEDVRAPTSILDTMASEAMYRMDLEQDLDEDEEEEIFNLEENIENPTSYNWEDKYRPRKPRYFNRVHTGYEWNKYNQTHYEYVYVHNLVIHR
jgi:hypothetical protein